MVASQIGLEDALALVSRSGILEHQKGQAIYTRDQPSTGVYVVIEGKVKVCSLVNTRHQLLVGIYQADDFFGESALLGLPQRDEQATAMENSRLDGLDLGGDRGHRGEASEAVALLQILVKRTIDFSHRIESFSVDNVARRLANSLIWFSERLARQTATARYR
jgi:hypothetical protein